jgi:putative transposase
VSDTPARREAAGFLIGRVMSARRACWWLNVSRSWLKYASRRNDDELVERLMALAKDHPRYGTRRLHALLRREGMVVNLKRVRRLCVRHGLLLKQKRRRKRRGIGAGVPCRAEHPNQVWAYDFVEDRTESGRKLRILTVVDEFTRECVEVEVEHRMNAKFVARALMRLFRGRGVPRFIRSDNGPEFIARFLMRLFAIHGVEARHIEPGSPSRGSRPFPLLWQNGLNERFNGSLRDECLNLETFHNRDHARALIKLYARSYNERRPHSSLGYQTPRQFAAKWRRENQETKDGCAGGTAARLTHGPPPAVREEAGLTLAKEDQPDSRMAIHDGAPVARQQSRILRVDDESVSKKPQAGKFPAQQRVEASGSL